MTEMEADITAYEEHRQRLELDYTGRWVLIQARALVGVFDSFDEVVSEAVRRFGRGPYLIRQISDFTQSGKTVRRYGFTLVVASVENLGHGNEFVLQATYETIP
jgi:hypothetical protein